MPRKSVRTFLTQGFARLYRRECRRSYAVAFSCRQRYLCPSCHQKQELIWVDFATEDLLEAIPQFEGQWLEPSRPRWVGARLF